MPEPLVIDVVSDVVCPWCFVGKRRLEKALALVPEVPVAIHWRPYQLSPEIPAGGVPRQARHDNVEPSLPMSPAKPLARAKGARLQLGVLPDLIGYQLRMAQVALFKDFSQGPGVEDVSPGLFGVLVIIEANPDLKQSELARATHLDRSTVVTVIDNLEKRGLVERRVALHDRRSNAIRLTEAGAVLLKKLKRQVAAHEKRLLQNFSPEEHQTFIALLQKVFPEHR